MLDELVGEKTYFQIYILNITGKLVDKNLADWLEAFYGTISWPDPRIWCNQIGALAGVMRSDPVSAVVAGCLASDSRLYGAGVFVPTARFIQTTLSDIRTGACLKECLIKELTTRARHSNNPVIIGYSRPIATGDERVPILKAIAKKYRLIKGPHEILSEEIDRYVSEKHAEGINVGGYAAAVLSDYGFTPIEIYRLTSLLVNSGVQACYTEYYDKPIDSFLPLACEDIEYTGPAPRSFVR